MKSLLKEHDLHGLIVKPLIADHRGPRSCRAIIRMRQKRLVMSARAPILVTAPPGRSISNAFCSECGSGLPYVSKAGGSLVVQAGTLDTAVKSTPKVRHIFGSERAGWYDTAATADCDDGYPE